MELVMRASGLQPEYLRRVSNKAENDLDVLSLWVRGKIVGLHCIFVRC